MTVITEAKNETGKFSLVVGLLAGFGFALGMWGVGSFELLQAHAMLPLAAFLVGGAACLLVGLLAGWLTWRFVPVLVNVVIWALVGAAFNRLSLYITYPVQDRLLAWLQPDSAALVHYPLETGMVTRAGLLLGILVVGGAIAGLLANNFVEEAASSEGFRRLLALFIWTAAFFGLGLTSDSLNQMPIRAALRTVDEAIQFTRSHTEEELPPEVVTQMGMRGLRSVRDRLQNPYRLVPAEYDQMLVFIKILIRFEPGGFASCTVINNTMGTCFPVEEAP